MKFIQMSFAIKNNNVSNNSSNNTPNDKIKAITKTIVHKIITQRKQNEKNVINNFAKQYRSRNNKK
jgi:hypothetical protein